MNWYEVEYLGGKSKSDIKGTYAGDLEEVLLSNNPPRFIKLENVSYFSRISYKFELYERWHSEWSNEILIKTASIISVRPIKGDLLTEKYRGEIHAPSKDTSIGIMISSAFADAYRSAVEEILKPKIEELFSEAGPHFGPSRGSFVVELDLLKADEFMIKSFGRKVKRQSNPDQLVQEIIEEVQKIFPRHMEED